MMLRLMNGAVTPMNCGVTGHFVGPGLRRRTVGGIYRAYRAGGHYIRVGTSGDRRHGRRAGKSQETGGEYTAKGSHILTI